jgi:hypothetical protein
VAGRAVIGPSPGRPPGRRPEGPRPARPTARPTRGRQPQRQPADSPGVVDGDLRALDPEAVAQLRSHQAAGDADSNDDDSEAVSDDSEAVSPADSEAVSDDSEAVSRGVRDGDARVLDPRSRRPSSISVMMPMVMPGDEQVMAMQSTRRTSLVAPKPGRVRGRRR